MIKTSKIKKLHNNEWAVISLKGKQLGKYKTKQEALKRLKQIEFFKQKNASKTQSYSSFMRDLVKSKDKEEIKRFQSIYKELFDKSVLENNFDEETLLNDAMEEFNSDNLTKAASAINLGDPDFAGEYLANIIKFLLRRISDEKRTAAIQLMKKKIYYINEFSIAAKKIPASAAYGQAITLLKNVLIEHNPSYIRSVLNSIVVHL